MKKRIIATTAAASIAMTAVAALPAPEGAYQDQVISTSSSTGMKPQIATTAGGELKAEVLLTKADLDKARKRVEDGIPEKAPPHAQSSKLPDHRKSGSRYGKPAKANAATFKKIMTEARSFATKAKKHPFKAEFGPKDASGLSLTPVNAVTQNYPVGATPPADLASLCFGTDAEQFTFMFDRYTYCSRMPFSIDYWETDPVTGEKKDHLGTSSGRMEIFGQNYSDTRSTRLFTRVQEGSVTYDWGPWDNYWTAPGVELSVNGQCEASVTKCHVSSGPATMTWGTWSNNTSWFNWNVNSATFDPMYGRDKIGIHSVRMEAYTDTAEYHTETPVAFPDRVVRCDSATYFSSARPESCVFLETVPRLEYSTAAGSANREVAQHIEDAFDYPDDTYPTSDYAKIIPGEFDGTWSGPGLHRLTGSLHQAMMDDNTEHKDAACHQEGDYASSGLPIWLRPEPGYQDCDEYPFRSTLEGAASTEWDFSVRAVDDSQNRSAGATLNNFYGWDRILAWDETLPAGTNDSFYVQIHDF